MRVLLALSCALVAGAAIGCGGPQKTGSSGATCFRDDDCNFGLVCAVPPGGSARVCTSDVGGLISLVDAGLPAGGSGGGSASGGGTAGASGSGGSSGQMAGASK